MKSAQIIVPTAYGTPFEGGFYGGQIRIDSSVHAIAWAPKAQGQTRAIWLPSYTDVPGAASCYDSAANTQAMAAAGSPMAQWAQGLDINGKTDWLVPARDVLEMGYRYLKPTQRKNLCSFRDGDNASSLPPGYPYTEADPVQTTAAEFQEGGPEAFDDDWYAASTQYSARSAWCQNFYSGGQLNYDKKYAALCRAVRLIRLSA
jgi:hypothetical protein